MRPAASLLALMMAACGTAPTQPAPLGAVPVSNYDLQLQELSADHLFSARTTARASFVGPVALSVDSALPLVQARTASLFASSLSVGDADSRISYTARYSLDPGAVLDAEQLSGLTAPQELGGQRVGQNVKLQLPSVAGAPVALDFSHEEQDIWTLSGYSETQRRVADLSWQPWIATVNLQWAGAASGIDADLALDCELRGSLRMPVATRRLDRYRALRLSGRSCEVTSATPFQGQLGAQTYGLSYVWGRTQRETTLRLSAIDPVWRNEFAQPGFDPSYELAVAQVRTLGTWTAKGLVSLRYTDAYEPLLADEVLVALPAGASTQWVTSASLTRRLPVFSVSANWARGADPSWFLPNTGQRSDRLGLALDFSRWMQELAPGLTPSLAMSWNWSQAHSANQLVTGESALKLKMSVMW